MRQIGHLASEAQARVFGDFLVARGIRSDIERESATSWSVWIRDEDQVPEAQQWFARFFADPHSGEFRRAATEAEKVRVAEARESAAFRGRIRTRRSLFPGSAGYGAGYLTYGLIVACVAIGFLSKLDQNAPFLRPFFISYPENGSAGFLPEVRAGELWRLFTPILIHFGPAHLLFNMLWLFQLGSMIEGRQGHTHFALLVLGLAVGSNVAQYTIHGPGFGGMSGVIYGLFGYIWLRGRFDPGSGLFIDRQNVVLMIVWFFACMTGWIGPVANVAHGAGLALGAAWGYLSARLARHGPR